MVLYRDIFLWIRNSLCTFKIWASAPEKLSAHHCAHSINVAILHMPLKHLYSITYTFYGLLSCLDLCQSLKFTYIQRLIVDDKAIILMLSRWLAYLMVELCLVNHTCSITTTNTWRTSNLDLSSNSFLSFSLFVSHTPPFLRSLTHTHTHARRHTWEGWRRAVCSALRSIVINCGVNRGSSTSPALWLRQGCRARLCSALHNGTP